MTKLIIIKLGGSIVSNKRSGSTRLNCTLLKCLARELAAVVHSQPHLRFLLLHGAGSFGHPLAYRYGLVDGALSRSRILGTAATILAMRELGSAVAKIFLAADVPVIPFQTSALANISTGRLRLTNFETLTSIIKHHGVPLLNGDVVITDKERTSIISADEIAVALAVKLVAKKLIFLSDVAGVYRRFPPGKADKPISKFTKADLKQFTRQKKVTPQSNDVTGGMMGKLIKLLPLQHCQIIICSGRDPKNLLVALKGKPVGTRIST